MTRMRNLAIALLSASLGACGTDPQPTPPVDSGTDSGVTPMDAPAVDGGNPGDAGAGDAGRDGGGRADRPDAGPTCGPLPIVPVARPTSGDSVRVMGNTTAAFMAQNPGPRPATTSPLRPPSGNTACVASRGQMVYSYTTGAMPAALRISTTNPGTPPTFDTVLWVTTRCLSTTTTITPVACNDDDPEFAAAADRRVSSSVTTPVFAANTRVFVVVGGFYPPATGGATTDRGPFELTIQELPPVPAGGACRVDGRTQRCDNNATTDLVCVGSDPGSATGTCRLRGSAAGSPCRSSEPRCDTGLTCSGINICQNTVAASMPCDAFNACEAGNSCLRLTVGSLRGVCTRAGSGLGTACRPVGATGGRCDAPLVCTADVDPTDMTPTCVRQAAPGGECAAGRVICGAGETCITIHGGLIGTCRPNGTAAGAACRPATGPGMPCDGTLRCRAPGEGMAPRCINVVAAGEPCDETRDCPDLSTCFLTDLSNRFVGRCGPTGGPGGNCNATGAACSGTLMCSNTETPGDGLCQNVVAAGMPCTRPVDRCAEGLTCVLNEGSLTTGTCRAEGSVAGAECRAGDMPCAAGLVCSGTALSSGFCQTPATAGGMCNPLLGTIRCPMGQVCAATAHNRGTCAAVTGPEMEPNDSPAAVMASPVSGTVTRSGSMPFGDVDCVAVTVPANGSITALASDGNGRCPGAPGGITLDLYGTDGTTWRGSSSNSALGRCAMIDGTRAAVFPYASNLPAGVYYVCARGLNTATINTAAIDGYVLSVSVGAAVTTP